MIDSVLKGTGNSRFLKSAVPAGTSWADALAMLHAGTFPIDFNGINTEGFQQVGTPLNKANLLKDVTAAQIGLPPSTTPDGMFQALGNTGELHVWRKTVKNAADVPAGYILGTKTTKTILNTNDNSSGSSAIYYSNSVSVSDSGTVSLKNPTTMSVDIYTSSLPIVGKFFYIDLSSVQTSGLIQKKIYFIPSDTDISVGNSPKSFSGVVQEVTGYPLTPAGTTTTYPVSTNPKAYQEGDDAKAAGYVVGEVVSGSFKLGITAASDAYMWKASSALTVTDTGVPSLLNPTNGRTGSGGDLYSESVIKSFMAGKFVQYVKRVSDTISPPDDFPPFNATPSSIVYVPSDVVVSYSNENYIIDRYQPVTGYPAIPAGTTIEYLGKLGDKARVQVVSYVGTGVSGIGHKNSLTFDFAPKVVIISSTYKSGYSYAAIIIPGIKNGVALSAYQSGQSRTGFAIISEITEKTVNWYSDSYVDAQMNTSGTKYMAVAIG